MFSSVISAVTGVFSAVGTWIITFVNNVISLFWAIPEGGTEHELTFLGVFALMSLAIALFLLIVNFIVDFIRFR